MRSNEFSLTGILSNLGMNFLAQEPGNPWLTHADYAEECKCWGYETVKG